MSRLTICSAVASAMMVLPLCAAPPTYWQDVYPIMRKNCTVCHSQRTLQEPEVSAGLALDTYQSMRRGGKQPVVVAGKSAASRLVQVLRLNDDRKRMPLDAKPLSDDDVSIIRSWIDAGAVEGSPPAESSLPAAAATIQRRQPVSLLTRIVRPASVEMVLPVGPLSPATAAAYSPDAKLLATGTYGRVAIWNTQEARVVATLTNVLGAVNDLKFSPDGSLLAVAGGQPSARGDLRLFRVSDWKLAESFGGHLDVVASVAFSPDGSRLASASFDKTVRIWDVAKKVCEKTLSAHSDFVYSVAFGPKGDWLVSASKDRTIRLIDVKTGSSRLTFSGMDQDVLAVAVSPDGSAVVSSGYEAALHWWNPLTGERIRRQGAHDVAVHELAFDRTGKIIASAGGDKSVRWFDGTTGAPIRALPIGTMAFSVAVRPDGQQIATGGADGLVRVIDVATARVLLTLLHVPGASAESDWLALTPEGFVAGSDGLLGKAAWKSAGKELPASGVRAALHNSVNVAKAWKGEKLIEATIPAGPK